MFDSHPSSVPGRLTKSRSAAGFRDVSGIQENTIQHSTGCISGLLLLSAIAKKKSKEFFLLCKPVDIVLGTCCCFGSFYSTGC